MSCISSAPDPDVQAAACDRADSGIPSSTAHASLSSRVSYPYPGWPPCWQIAAAAQRVCPYHLRLSISSSIEHLITFDAKIRKTIETSKFYFACDRISPLFSPLSQALHSVATTRRRFIANLWNLPKIVLPLPSLRQAEQPLHHQKLKLELNFILLMNFIIFVSWFIRHM